MGPFVSLDPVKINSIPFIVKDSDVVGAADKLAEIYVKSTFNEEVDEIDNKLCEKGIEEVGKPLVLNLNITVSGLFEFAPQD